MVEVAIKKTLERERTRPAKLKCFGRLMCIDFTYFYLDSESGWIGNELKHVYVTKL